MSINMERVAELTEIESKRLNERTKGSGEMYNRARNSLSGGVASSTSCASPGPFTSNGGRGRRSGMLTATRCGTSTTASDRCFRGMPTR